jgi:hypothetical protein
VVDGVERGAADAGNVDGDHEAAHSEIVDRAELRRKVRMPPRALLTYSRDDGQAGGGLSDPRGT